jgi:ribose 5-phosphate isomerase B
MMKIFLASDHAGLDLKNKILHELRHQGFIPNRQLEVHDLGPQTTDSVDYPDFADLVCKKIHGFSVISNENEPHFPKEVGILVCGSGQGMSIRANKFPHIRAALCWTPQIGILAREHNDANVLCLGSRVIDYSMALEIVKSFLTTPFAGGRHSQRVVKINRPIGE